MQHNTFMAAGDSVTSAPPDPRLTIEQHRPIRRDVRLRHPRPPARSRTHDAQCLLGRNKKLLEPGHLLVKEDLAPVVQPQADMQESRRSLGAPEGPHVHDVRPSCGREVPAVTPHPEAGADENDTVSRVHDSGRRPERSRGPEERAASPYNRLRRNSGVKRWSQADSTVIVPVIISSPTAIRSTPEMRDIQMSAPR